MEETQAWPLVQENPSEEEMATHSTTAGRNINNLRYTNDSTLMAETEEEQKSLFMRMKEWSEKADLNSTFKKQRSWHAFPSLHGN